MFTTLSVIFYATGQNRTVGQHTHILFLKWNFSNTVLVQRFLQTFSIYVSFIWKSSPTRKKKKTTRSEKNGSVPQGLLQLKDKAASLPLILPWFVRQYQSYSSLYVFIAENIIFNKMRFGHFSANAFWML